MLAGLPKSGAAGEGRHGFREVTPIARAASSRPRKALALRSNHQQLTPEHLLKTLLDDKEGLAAGLIRAAGGERPRLQAVEAELAKLPKVEGAGAGQIYLSPELARLFEQAETLAEKAGDSFVTAERLLLALAMAAGTAAGQGPGRCRRDAAGA